MICKFLFNLIEIKKVIYLSGTSPLYVLETIFHNKKSPPSEFQCIGAVSLIIWSLILVVSIKYSIFILKADNKGEGKDKKYFFENLSLLKGGTFALCALLTGKSSTLKKKSKAFVNILSILAASLLIGKKIFYLNYLK